jgi:protein-disulfide isomerase
VVLAVLVAFGACQKGGQSGDLAERVKKLEDEMAKQREIAEFVRPIMEQQKKEMAERAAREPDPNARFAINIEGNDFEGPAGAAVTIIKAYDFACPYCQQVAAPLEQIIKESNGKVRVVYKNFVIHPDTAMAAHLASCAAGKQGKFSEFKNVFWEKGFNAYRQSGDASKMGRDNILAMAGELGLDKAKFTADLDGAECKKLVDNDMQELMKFKVNGTPSFFVNGKAAQFQGMEPFKQLVDKELKEAEASGVPAAEYYQKVVMEKGEKEFKPRGKVAEATGG